MTLNLLTTSHCSTYDRTVVVGDQSCTARPVFLSAGISREHRWCCELAFTQRMPGTHAMVRQAKWECIGAQGSKRIQSAFLRGQYLVCFVGAGLRGGQRLNATGGGPWRGSCHCVLRQVAGSSAGPRVHALRADGGGAVSVGIGGRAWPVAGEVVFNRKPDSKSVREPGLCRQRGVMGRKLRVGGASSGRSKRDFHLGQLA